MSVLAHPHRIVISPSVSLGGRGPIAQSVDGETPDCPTCGGELDLSQPGIEDELQLVGCCVECHRLSLVLADELSRQFALALPSREEALAEILARTSRVILPRRAWTQGGGNEARPWHGDVRKLSRGRRRTCRPRGSSQSSDTSDTTAPSGLTRQLELVEHRA